MGACRRAWDFISGLFLLTGSILFVVGAIGFVCNSSNKYSGPVYVACSINYLLGSVITVGIYTVELLYPSTIQ